MMSIVTEKRTIKIPPCKIDKGLIREIGQIMEMESEKIREEVIRDAERSGIKNAKKFVDDMLSSEYFPSYVLKAKSRDVESHKIEHFVDTKWPPDTYTISLSLGGRAFARDVGINVEINLESTMAKRSRVSVSGRDATWVHGIADRIEQIIRTKKLGYGAFVDHEILRVTTYIILLLGGLGVAYFVSPTVMEERYNSIWVFYFVLGVGFLEGIFRQLYPRFEFGGEPFPKKIRKWIWTIVVGSGVISAIVLKIIGLS